MAKRAGRQPWHDLSANTSGVLSKASISKESKKITQATGLSVPTKEDMTLEAEVQEVHTRKGRTKQGSLFGCPPKKGRR
jgi:hypothetical protein